MGKRVAVKILPLMVALMALLAIPLRVIEEANPDWRVLNYYFGLQAILVTALVIDGWGGRSWLRHFAFPLLFPLVAIPWPSEIESDLIQGLQRCVAALGVEGASWMGWSAWQSGNLIVLPQGVVGINEACSGIRSLQSSLMISFFLGDYFQLSTARRWLLIAFAFVLNVLRAFLLMAMMALHGSETLMKFHDPAGVTIALGNLLLLYIAANFLAGGEPIPANPVPRQDRGLSFSLRLGVILLAAWVGAELFNQGWYLWHERNTVPAPAWTLRWPPPRAGFQDLEIDESARSLLRYNQGLHGKWNDQFQWQIFFFAWDPGGSAADLARSHHPDICLPAIGLVMKEDLGVDPMEINGVALAMNRYIFQDPSNGRFLYVFQVLSDDRVLKGEAMKRVAYAGTGALERLKAAWAGRRNPGQRSLLVINQGAHNLPEAEIALQGLLQDSLMVSPTPASLLEK